LGGKRHVYETGHCYNLMKLLNVYHNPNDNNSLYAICQCIVCGNIVHMRARLLFDDRYTSCRCQIITHNMNKTKIYSIYHNMKYRCLNPHCHAYKDYGGRGIIICNEWLGEHGFETFYNWAINNGYQEGLSIDRIDLNGDYEPSNCRWITRGENAALGNKQRKYKINKATKPQSTIES